MATRKVMLTTLFFFLPIASLKSGGISQDPSACTSSRLFSIAKHGDLICLPVRISTSDKGVMPFLFATGTGQHVIDTRLLRAAEQLPHGFARPGTDSQQRIVPIYDNGKATDRGLTLRVADSFLSGPDPIFVFDLSLVREATGRNVRGIVGAPFLQNKLVVIDFDQGTMRIDLTRQLNRRNWESLPLMANSNGIPLATGIQLGSRIESFVLNTGDTESVTVHRWLFDTLVRTGNIRISGVVRVMTQAGKKTPRQGRLTSLKWGSFHHRDLLVVEGEKNILGLSYLSRFLVAFDMPSKRIHLRRGALYDKPDLLNNTGLHILIRDGRVIVATVDRNSPAQRAGVLDNDEMITINSHAVSQMPLFDVLRVLRKAQGQDLVLTLKRRGSIVKISFSVPVDSTLVKEIATKGAKARNK